MQERGLAGSRFRVDVLDTVGLLTTAPDLQTLYRTFARAVGSFKIEHFIISGIPLPTEPLERAVFLRNWPKGWFEMYVRRGFVKVDPTVRLCQSTTMPFEWSEAKLDPRQPAGADVINFARDYGLKGGYSVPIHGLKGRVDCVSVGGLTPELDPVTKPALHLMAMYTFERARRLVEEGGDTAAASNSGGRKNPLTLREQEVLTWAAVGKSHADICDILGITERTVTAHIVNASSKLGASNRTHAVVKALLGNHINI